MIKAAVLGSPISHSLSPAIHKRAYDLLKVDASYVAVELLPEFAEDFLATAHDQGWTGFSLTMPLKEVLFDLKLPFDLELDPIAVRMKSANTLVSNEDGYFATSTDRTAFMRLFAGVRKDRVAIIGGGGTARAALGALDGQCEEIHFLLRNLARAEVLSEVAQGSQLAFYDMTHSLAGYDLVISTVPKGATDEIAYAWNYEIPTFCEVLYNPLPTKILDRAKMSGSVCIDGIDLLVEQALDQISLFSGLHFDFADMREDLKAVALSHINSN